MPTSALVHTHAAASWAISTLSLDASNCGFSPVSGDASFRQYFRLTCSDSTWVVVDSPPAQEDNESFVAVLNRLADAGLPVPQLIDWQKQQGFMLLEDFGDQLLLAQLNQTNVDQYYLQAMQLMSRMQAVPTVGLPVYDKIELLRELHVFNEWFVEGLLGYTVSTDENQIIESTFESLCESALAQPQGFVHRDYHSRNIMLLANGDMGLIDFQDALKGPVTYDLASILRDCYISWPREKVETWALSYAEMLRQQNSAFSYDDNAFLRDFDLMGLQRHIKVLGVFARLKLRDNKTAYIKDLPLVLAYTVDVAGRYPECQAFVAWFEKALMPLVKKQAWYKPIAL